VLGGLYYLKVESDKSNVEYEKSSELSRRLAAIVSTDIECQLTQCGLYSLTVRLRNRSQETISGVSVGWVFMPEGQSACPTSYPTKYQEKITLRPGDTTVLNIDRRTDGPTRQFRYCVAVTGIDIVP
jgi:hypothetical protein